MIRGTLACDDERRPTVRVLLLAASVVSASAGTVQRALADGPTAEDQALATTLFREAKTLLDAGKVPEACRKLERASASRPPAARC